MNVLGICTILNDNTLYKGMVKIKEQTYLTLQEVAYLFQVSISTIARWRRNGLLPAKEINKRHFLFAEDDIKNFVEGVK